MKEMIFNILGEMVADSTVLDLFSGSGSLGLEALSRGARDVTFVENGVWAQKTIRKNLHELGLEKRAKLICRDAFQVLRELAGRGENFTLIFLDPPYNKGLVKKLLNHLDQSDIVSPFSQVILHRSRQEDLPEGLKRLQVVREKEVGQACLSFLSTRR
jgi:16S rRNA (guanine(966)-N(2))-methyltransferase RsmD